MYISVTIGIIISVIIGIIIGVIISVINIVIIGVIIVTIGVIITVTLGGVNVDDGNDIDDYGVDVVRFVAASELLFQNHGNMQFIWVIPKDVMVSKNGQFDKYNTTMKLPIFCGHSVHTIQMMTNQFEHLGIFKNNFLC